MSQRCGCEDSDSLTLVRELNQATAFSHPEVPASSATSTAGVYKSGRKTTGTFSWTDTAAGGEARFQIVCANLQTYPVRRIQSWFAFTVLICSSREDSGSCSVPSLAIFPSHSTLFEATARIFTDIYCHKQKVSLQFTPNTHPATRAGWLPAHFPHVYCSAHPFSWAFTYLCCNYTFILLCRRVLCH